MAALRPGTARLFVPPFMQCRHAGKFQTKNPRRVYKRRLLESVTEPVFPERIVDPTKFCGIYADEARHPQEDAMANKYKEYLKRKCLEKFEAHPTVVIYQLHSVKANDEKLLCNKLWHKQFWWSEFEPIVVDEVLQGTKFHNLLPLVDETNRYVFADNTNIKQLLSITNKMPELLLLGGIVDNRILTRAGLVQYAASPPIESLHGELSAVLNSAAQKTHSLLNSHQQKLSINLEQYVKQSTDVTEHS